MLNTLLIESDPGLALSIISHLEVNKSICDYTPNGLEGLALIERNQYDVIILAVSAQGMDGLSLCQRIRTQGNDTPVLMLATQNSLACKLDGFNAGADDYMVKPFDIEELAARLQVLSKRRSGQVYQLAVGPLQLNLKNRTGHINNQPVKLTPTAFKLLEVLLRASPAPVSQYDLFQKVWGDDLFDGNKLRVHIHKIRKMLRSVNADHLLKTAPGFGFYICQ